ncbi:calpain family cysteine protease [Ceratobasidium sp. AG-Ba]|nr:calpain family cysteine protease [Ceratobasidium sp. AG-Ba]QRV99591.1 calpain family cysteine protease [Ceratobasidium sp. AG-Ba]
MPIRDSVRGFQKKVAKEFDEGMEKYNKRNKMKRTNTEHFEQPKEQADLLVTAELEAAITRCKAKVDAISKQCRARNRRFRDVEFDLVDDRDRCLHSLDTEDSDRHTPADVLRVTEIFHNPKFFVDGIQASDISQGSLGDCWLLSALATMTTMPQLIEKICVARDEKVGVYGFIFYRDSGWQEVIIDDYLFTKVPKWECISGREQMLYHKNKDNYNLTARKGGRTLCFASCGDEEETWVPLLEKAYAKLVGDYSAVSGGFAAEGIEDLTGGVATKLDIADILDTDEFWKNELMLANVDRLFGCSIKQDGADEEINGLLQGHAYSVVRAVEVNGKRFVRLRNPWGHHEWNGRWSDGSKEWTSEWMALLPQIGHRFGNDGEFVMEYTDFLKTWSTIDRCRVFDSSWSMSSMWIEVMCRPFPCAWNYGDVSFTISVEKATPSIIVLSRLDTRAFAFLSGCYIWNFDFNIFRKGGELQEPLLSSSHTGYWRRSVNLEIDLEPGEYVVHVRLDREMTRAANYLSEKAMKPRKLSRVLTEQMQAKAIAVKCSGLSRHLRVAQSTYAAKDLTELEMIRLQPNPDIVEEDGDDGDVEEPEEEEAEGEGEEEEEKKSHEGGGENGEQNGEVGVTIQDGGPSGPTHDRRCNECGVCPIVGPLYHCMDIACDDYDACQNCMAKIGHPDSHRVVRIEDPGRTGTLSKVAEDDSDNAITLGLRVYTKTSAPITVNGQLRHGSVIHWTKDAI